MIPFSTMCQWQVLFLPLDHLDVCQQKLQLFMRTHFLLCYDFLAGIWHFVLEFCLFRIFRSFSTPKCNARTSTADKWTDWGFVENGLISEWWCIMRIWAWFILFNFELHYKRVREHRAGARRTLTRWIEINEDDNFFKLEVEGLQTGLACSESWKESLKLWRWHAESINWPIRIFLHWTCKGFCEKQKY